jgi:hypothetical protein
MKPETKRLGSQTARIEGDLVVLKWVGEIFPDDVTDLHALMDSMLADHDIVFLVVDATEARSVGAEARRRAASWSNAYRLGGIAVFGAGLTVRTLVTLVQALQKILFPKNMFVMEFVQTEQTARAWLDSRRRRIHSGRTE